MTLRERYTRYLVEHGWCIDTTKPQSRKYKKYSHPTRAGWYFIGKHGAIRFNFDNNSSLSRNSEFTVKPTMIAWEKEQGYVN